MPRKIQRLLASWPIRVALIIAAILTIGQWVILAIYGWRLPPEIPLFYSLPFGESQLAPKHWFLIIPAISLIFFLISLMLIRFSESFPEIYRRIVAWASCLNIFLLSIVMVHIVYLAL